jgi:hypothetical protein
LARVNVSDPWERKGFYIFPEKAHGCGWLTGLARVNVSDPWERKGFYIFSEKFLFNAEVGRKLGKISRHLRKI